MTMQTSPVPILYPELCPNCSNFQAQEKKCLVSEAASGAKFPSEVMIHDLTGLCAYYEPLIAAAPGIVSSVLVAPDVSITHETEGGTSEPAMATAAEATLEPADADNRTGTLGDGMTPLEEAMLVINEAEGALPPELNADLPIETLAIEAPAQSPVSAEPAPEEAVNIKTEEAQTAVQTAEPGVIVEESVEPPSILPAGEIQRLGEARIHCPKCKVENAASAVRCQNCGEQLLPGEGAGVRIVYFVFGSAIAAGLAYLFYRFYILNPGSAPEMDIFSPVALGVGAFAFLISGIVFSVRRTPLYTRFENRARFHLGLNPWQSLADMNQAIDTAPQSQQARLIKMRSGVYEKLGMADDAMRDRLLLITSPQAYKVEAENVSMFTGADADVYARSRRRDQIDAVLRSGKAVAVGYCPKCSAVVELDSNERCKVHPKTRGQEPEYVIAADLFKGKLAELKKLERSHMEAKQQLTGLLAAGEAVALGWCPKHPGVVALDVERKCITHPKVRGKWVTYVVPAEVEKGKKAVLEEMKQKKGSAALARTRLILVLVALVLLYMAYRILMQ